VHSYDDPSHVDWSYIYKIPKVIEKYISFSLKKRKKAMLISKGLSLNG
jgi:hypothetical protein